MLAKTTKITATSRASIKIGDSFYTMEYAEERAVPEDITTEELQIERKELWDTVNNECDNQIAETIQAYNSVKK